MADDNQRVLVVDDEEGIRNILQRLLSRLPTPPPVEIETAHSAEDALDRLEKAKFTLILTDFNMGGRDGVFLLATASRRWPDMARALMTGYTDEEIDNDAREKGKAALVIRKPWNNRELLEQLGKLIQPKETTP